MPGYQAKTKGLQMVAGARDPIHMQIPVNEIPMVPPRPSSPMVSPQTITVDQMRLVLSDVIDALESPEFSTQLDEAKEAAGNEMLKMMQLVFPMVVHIEMEVLKRHHFINTREGIVHFTQMVRDMETLDGEVGRLHNQIRSYYLPPVSISSSVDTSL